LRKEEFDFPEANLDQTLGGHIHQLGVPSNNAYNLPTQTAVLTDWHVYTICWTPAYIQFLLDGVQLTKYTGVAGIPIKTMHWIQQIETQLSGVPPASSVSGNVYIDWFTVYSYTAGNSRFGANSSNQRLRRVH
jgi:beta-glucanase (GH16 family)